MKFAVVLSLVSLVMAAGPLKKRTCAGNNCNRAVTGTRPGLLPLSSRSADCESYLLTLVTPTPVTVTVTVDPQTTFHSQTGSTYTITDISETEDPVPVTFTPTHMPDYAEEMCTGTEYASACTCFGLTGAITTLAPATVTVTETNDICFQPEETSSAPPTSSAPAPSYPSSTAAPGSTAA
ncbi:hypothetical protein OQA88_11284 [Cercophora sp. LCS_1]